MSLRRSSRKVAQTAPTAVSNGVAAQEAPVPAKKRARKSTVTADAQHTATNDADAPADDASAMPPPQTPLNKRRRTAKAEVQPPPLTPTPSAIGLMTSSSPVRRGYSSGDVDDSTPPPPETRPIEPHRTNAILVTPRGTQLQPSYSTFDQSPSKPGSTVTSSETVLDEACKHMITVAPDLRTLIESFRCTPFSPEGLSETIDPFRSLVTGIMSQQVSGAAARSIKNKFIGLFSEDACPTGFPMPPMVASTPLPRLREAGLSQRKAEYIQGLAEKFANGELTVEKLLRGTDEEVMTDLVAVRGLGRWSVEMFMCFGLKRLDVFSTGDLGIQRGMAVWAGRDVNKLKNKGGKWKYMSEQDMLEKSEPFRPYRSLFMWYMWRIEDIDVDAMQNN